MKKLLSLFAVAVVALAAQATDLTVFDGTAQNEYIPIRATYFDWSPYYGQVIYPAAQLAAMEGQDISAMKFYIANEGGNVMNGGKLAFYLGTTDQNSFPSYSPSLISESSLTLVAEVPMNAGDTEIVVEFDEPWTYAGGNLVLEVSVAQEGSYSGTGYFYGENVDTYGSAYGAYSVTAVQFYPKTTFTYEGGGEEPGIATLAEANALEDAAEFTFGGDAVVTVCWKGSVYLRDESGYGQISGVDPTFENGQVLSPGWNATKTSDDGWVKYIDATNLSASGEVDAELAAAQELTGAVDESMLNAYVCVLNVEKGFFPIKKLPLPDGSSIDLTGTGNQGTTGTYDVYGIIWKVDGKLVFEPVKWVKYVAPQWRLGDVNHDNAVDVADVTLMISYILGLNPDGFYTTEANCDGAGSIDVSDVTALINMILNQ